MKPTNEMIRVKQSSDIPLSKHYAVLEFREVTESSGWGSENDSSVSAPHYYITEDVAIWESHIKMLEANKRSSTYNKVNYAAFIVEKKAIIETQIKIG